MLLLLVSELTYKYTIILSLCEIENIKMHLEKGKFTEMEIQNCPNPCKKIYMLQHFKRLTVPTYLLYKQQITMVRRRRKTN